MSDDTPERAARLRTVRELEGHLDWLMSFTGAALAVLAAASGIYTYLGVSSLLDDTGTVSVFAALAYSVAVSVGIFVFWSYLMRLLPAVRTGAARLGLFVAMVLGSLAIIAMSSWLNAAALAGAAAVEQHLAESVEDYSTTLEAAHEGAVAALALKQDVARVRQGFQDLSQQEASGGLSGLAGRGAVFRVLDQKAAELDALEAQIEGLEPQVAGAFDEGNAILSQMRALTVDQGSVEGRSVAFSEEAVRLSGLITELRQLSVAPLVERAANDLAASVVLPRLDGIDADARAGQAATIDSVLEVLGQRAETLRQAAQAVMARPAPPEITYTPLSTADAVIRYASDFGPSWAGAIAIDLLPAILVLILAVTHGAIRAAREPAGMEGAITLAEARIAIAAFREVEGSAPTEPPTGPKPLEEGAPPPPTPLHRAKE